MRHVHVHVHVRVGVSGPRRRFEANETPPQHPPSEGRVARPMPRLVASPAIPRRTASRPTSSIRPVLRSFVRRSVPASRHPFPRRSGVSDLRHPLAKVGNSGNRGRAIVRPVAGGMVESAALAASRGVGRFVSARPEACVRRRARAIATSAVGESNRAFARPIPLDRRRAAHRCGPPEAGSRFTSEKGPRRGTTAAAHFLWRRFDAGDATRAMKPV